MLADAGILKYMLRPFGCKATLMLAMPAFALLSAANAADRGEITRSAIARLSQEAGAFQRISPSLLGKETLQQRAKKAAPARFRPRVGQAAKTPPPPVWQDRQVVSEYAFVELAGDSETLHEIRKVLSVDGHAVTAKRGEESLARIISLKDDPRERELLKEFEKYGLAGAVTDFGPLLMLFTPSEIDHYGFNFRGEQMLGSTKAFVLKYSQIDGPEPFTIFENAPSKDHPKDHPKDQARHVRVQGEVWVRQDDYLPLRITVAVSEGDGASAVREEAAVDYASSQFGVLVPTAVDHKEFLGGQLSVQNSFVYKDFHRFAADSQINFNAP